MRVLVLNSNYLPLGVVDWPKAITLFFQNKAEILEEYDKVIRSVTQTFKMPAVIRLLKKVKNKLVGVKFNRTNVLLRDKCQCQYCGIKLKPFEATFDHVIPKSKGGLTNWTNIVTSCYSCNNQKDCRTPEEANITLINRPRKPDFITLDSTFSFRTKNKKDLPSKWENYL